ncbi:MAG: DUF2339 domain-containing protein [Lachnospiraceae bacterium]|nr:DUF2339 domain-containing protein [Lachnospiraceae bacterium]
MDNGRMGVERSIEMLRSQSQDENYTRYLESLLLQLRQGRITVQYAAAELNRTYPLYQQRMGMAQQYGQQRQYVQPQYVQQPQNTQLQYARPQYTQLPYMGPQNTQPQYIQPPQSIQPQYAQQTQSMPPQYVQQQQGIQQPQYIQQQGIQQSRYAQQPQNIQQAQYMQPLQNVQQAQYIQQVPYIQPPKAKRKNVEFAVGAGVLSVVGVLFVLIAFVLLSINYMNGMLKGMCLYGISVAVLLFSELYLQKKLPKLAIGITGLGICCLYLSTMINYLYFANFNVWIAAGISVLISLLAVLLGRKRDSGILKIISFIGCYVCIFPICRVLSGEQGKTQVIHFGFITVIVLFINLMTVFLPVKKNRVMANISHLIANTVFTIGFVNLMCGYLENPSYVLFFLLSILLVQGFVFYQLEKSYFDVESHKGKAGNVTAYTVTTGLMLVYFVVVSLLTERDGFSVLFHLASGIFLVVCGILFFLFRKSSLKWIQYWLFCPTVLLMYTIRLDGAAVSLHIVSGSLQWWKMGVTLAVFASAKILSRKKILRVSELLITIFTALQAVMVFIVYDIQLHVSLLYPEKEADLTAGLICTLCFLGAFLLSLAALYHWKSIYEEIVMCVFGLFILILFRNELTPAALMCVLFTGVILFNSIEFFRGKYIKIFNYINLAFIVCLYLAAAFAKNHVSYGIMLVLGISFMVLAFRERFGMDFKIKEIIFALFLCYMVLIWNIPIPILKSIVLMLIAIGAVTAGFAIRQKRLRITGLALTLVVCAKVVFYDFAGAQTVEKIILFLMVGLIALAISGIYLALEKKIV